jgi:arylsulfatase A-like enzyme/Flp pilus assembly protein TadD
VRRISSVRAAGIVLACLGASGAACGPAAPATPRNVVLVTIDTLRADRVGTGVAPALDRFATAGIQFTAARTPVPLTLPAHTSLLTGALPATHGVHVNGQVLPDDVPTLATVLRGAGYRTGAFVGAYVLDRRFGLARGFDTYDDRVPRDPRATERLEAERPANQVVDAALAWLDAGARQPFLLWVHLYDPHAPYVPPADAAAGAPTPYDGEVAFASAQAGRIFDRLEARGLAGSTVVVLAGDHGEGLGDHGELTHGMLAYDSTLRVPLVVAAPGEAPRRITAPVSLADVAPTLVRLAGVSGSLVAGASTRDRFAGDEDAAAFAETEYPASAGWSPLSVLATSRWKLIRSSQPELYDLGADPAEAANLAAGHRNEVQAMAARLTAARGVERARAAAAGAPDAQAKLRALGYVGGAVPGAASATAPNPATEIAAWGHFEQALSALARGEAAAALPLTRELAERFPAGPVFQATYARALLDSGRAHDAASVLRAAVARIPDDASLFHDLSVAAKAAGDDAEALRAEQAALALDAASPPALNGVGLLHVEAGRTREAVAAFEQATEGDPSNATYWSNLGNARRAADDLTGAETAYRRALDVLPGYADAANGLGVVLVQRGQAAQAVEWFERAIAAAPDFHEARLNLGIAYQESGRRAEAMAAYQQLLRDAPRSAARERAAATDLLRSLR